MPPSVSTPSRRAFLRHSSLLTLLAGVSPWALTLSAMGSAAAANASDYKALVCVFLRGGNDHWNTVVPYDSSSYTAYYSHRRNLAYPREELAPFALEPIQEQNDGHRFAFCPYLGPLCHLFQQGHLAILHNVGTLIEPTTKAQYLAHSVPLPPRLFSHNDQQSYWQAYTPEGARFGWGGRMLDLLAQANSQALSCFSFGGNSVFLAGEGTQPYQLGLQGAVPVQAVTQPLCGSPLASQALRQFMTGASGHWLEQAHAQVARRCLDLGEQISTALNSTAVPVPFPPAHNYLGNQLALVARLIAARAQLGNSRQVFFVTLDGFDTHDNEMAIHPGLMVNLGNALDAFYRATVALGLGEQVTLFTASDFGRTLVSNNDGTDHGWGSTHLVLGGAVQGGKFIGSAPEVASDGPDDIGQGRLLPQLAVQQYAATLGRWFGLSSSDLALILPHLGHFTTPDLGFMAA